MKIFLTLSSLLFSLIVCGQANDTLKFSRLDSLFDALYLNKMSMGSISIYRDGRAIYAKTYGISNISNKVEIPADQEKTVYRIGSVSKIITACLIMKAIEAGRISLHQSIESFFPTLANARRITIEKMLLHTSLLPVFHRVDDLDQLRKARTEQELIAVVNKRSMNTDTLHTTYNNLNYILLGFIVEKINGKSYNEVLAAALAEVPSPRMYGSNTLLRKAKGEANSFHIQEQQWVEDYENRESPLSDGSGFLLSDARTLNEFMYRLFNGQLIKNETLQQMLPTSSVFGFGLMKTNFDAHKGFGHSGRIEGFTCATSYYPAERLGITLLQNGTVYPMNDILILVGDILFDEPVAIPGFKRIELSDGDMARLAGVYANEKEGYKVLADVKKGQLRIRVARGHGLLNKMILQTYALEKNRLFNPRQGIILDFSNPEQGVYKTCVFKVNGAKLVLQRVAKN